MPPSIKKESVNRDVVPVTCPRCGYSQPEPRTAYSTICKNCQQHYRLQEALHPAAKAAKVVIEQRQIRCFQCGTELEAPKAAASTMCKRCSSHVDLSDYRITQTLSKNFRTHGWVVVEEKGYLLNTDTLAGEAVIKGRVIGKIAAVQTLEIHSSANIKGSFSAGKLVIPAGEHFRWAEPIRVGGAEIAGELAADLHSTGTVLLRAGARFFGNISSLHLAVEAGAVFVGAANVGKSAVPPPAPNGWATVNPKPREVSPAPVRKGRAKAGDNKAVEP
ncbi:MAG TPA: polymer-forming cytoskeletal protein [Verrucomicrobiae bacterium]|nr:polymer-forming cytoskeletal protein [Verrucomicrobiae bacterium]